MMENRTSDQSHRRHMDNIKRCVRNFRRQQSTPAPSHCHIPLSLLHPARLFRLIFQLDCLSAAALPVFFPRAIMFRRGCSRYSPVAPTSRSKLRSEEDKGIVNLTGDRDNEGITAKACSQKILVRGIQNSCVPSSRIAEKTSAWT
jgi:hypothetical protein